MTDKTKAHGIRGARVCWSRVEQAILEVRPSSRRAMVAEIVTRMIDALPEWEAEGTQAQKKPAKPTQKAPAKAPSPALKAAAKQAPAPAKKAPARSKAVRVELMDASGG